jgi:hypothetical protein
MFDLGLAPVAMSFVGASNKDDLKRIRELRSLYGETWPSQWLKSRNLEDWGDAWMEKYREYQKDPGLCPDPPGNQFPGPLISNNGVKGASPLAGLGGAQGLNL